jgi:hypothetical protein
MGNVRTAAFRRGEHHPDLIESEQRLNRARERDGGLGYELQS